MYEGKLYLVVPTADPIKESMRVYDFNKQEWDIWGLAQTPPATVCVKLGVYKHCLIQYGGCEKAHLSTEYLRLFAVLMSP